MFPDEIPLDDPKTYALLSRGETIGVFQVETPGMQGLLKKVRPENIGDISAVLALYRPGPMDNGYHTDYATRRATKQTSIDIHPELEIILSPILLETSGVICYQEQIMAIIAEVTGWSYAEAEDIFNGMRKKNLQKMERSRPAFYSTAQSRGFSTEAVDALWETLIPFSDYSFNKSHSVAYAIITYRTAYLKANHPVEYMTALLTSAARMKKPEDRDKYLAESVRMGINILPPDINDSRFGFTPTKKGIRYGLEGIKDVGAGAVEAIITRRPYRSIDDFFRRADPKVLNGRVLDALARSGTLDSLWSSREQLVEQSRELSRLAQDSQRAARGGQRSLLPVRFRPSSGKEGTPKKDSAGRAQWERDTLGAVVTRPRLLLRPSRPLTQTEWEWIRSASTRGQTELSVLLGKTEVKLAPVWDNDLFRRSVEGLGMVIEEC